MNVTTRGELTHHTRGQYALSVDYDAELQMARLRVRDLDGTTDLTVNVPTHKLARPLADAFDAAASDPNSIGYDTWRKEGNLPPRLQHLGAAL